MGKYFGIGNGKNSFKVDKVTGGSPDVINTYLIREQGTPDGSTLTGTISFNPKQEIYGVRLDYFQDVNTPFKKFFFKASLPVVHVQNDMGMKIPDGTTLNTFTLPQFFKGTVTQTGLNSQTPLTKAKIDGRRSITGIADLNLALGYKLHQSPQHHLLFNAGVLIPTGTKKKGDYLFEPRSGNGGHTGFMVGIDGGVQLWASTSKEASVRVLGALDYRYLLEATEYRTPMLKESFFPATANASGGKLNYYYAGNYLGKTSSLPAANVFTQGIKVKPGSQGEALIDLSFQCSGFVVDLGYNAFYKEKESVWLKNWVDDTFGIVPRDTNTSGASTREGFINTRGIKATDFDLESITNPSQFSHKLFGGIGYSFAMAQKYLATLGLGASYEFASDNAAMEAAALWAKMGISF
jgi:hypothetical protein